MAIPHWKEIPFFGVTSLWRHENPDLVRLNYLDLLKEYEVEWINLWGNSPSKCAINPYNDPGNPE